MKRVIAFVVSCLLMTILVGCNNYGTKLKYKKGELYYTKAVNEAEAKKAGEYLQNIGYFNDDKETSVQVDKSGDVYAVRFVVVEGADKNEEYAKKFQAVAREMSQNVFDGKKAEVHMCDDHLKTLKVISMN